MTQRAFWIIGAQRSGTSLLARKLNRHPDIAVPPESFFFNTFVPLEKYYGDLSCNENLDRLIEDLLATPKVSQWSLVPTREAILESLEGRSMGAVFRALLDSWADRQGKACWGAKTPHHVFYWPELEAAVPGAPLVHIVRDGRDVALGLVRARFGPKSIYMAAERWSRWMKAIEAIRSRVEPGRIHEIRYEDLLTEPERTLAGICDHIGLAYDPAMLEFYKDPTQYSRYAAEHANLHRPLLTHKVAAWRRIMRPKDVALCESVAAEALARHGYPVETDARPLSALQWAYYRWLHHPPRKAIGLVRNRPGQREELRLAIMRARIMARYWLQGRRVPACP